MNITIKRLKYQKIFIFKNLLKIILIFNFYSHTIEFINNFQFNLIIKLM